jgi:negative regulator of sigma E activity
MQLSTQTTNHISLFPTTVNLFVGNRMNKNCEVTKNSSIEATDYQSIKPSCDFRNLRKERVNEIKCVFV